MKTSASKKLNKKKHVHHYHKLKHCVKSRFKRKKSLSGRFAILVNEADTRNAALLKFIGPDLCEAKSAIVINKTILKLTSPKFVISRTRNRKLLRKVEVIISKRFRREYEILHSMIQEEKRCEKQKKTSPAKIYSCLTCNHKFTKRKIFLEHTHSHAVLNSSSGSEADLVIDDVLATKEHESKEGKHQAPLSIISDANELIADQYCCMMNNCERKFDTEEELVMHISMQHNIVDKPFPCKKCDESFARESALLSHNRMNHPIQVIEPQPLGSSAAVGQKVSLAFHPSDNRFVRILPKASTVNGIIAFQRFDSKKKVYICRICSTQFARRSHLDRHTSARHISKVYYCYKCHVPYSSSIKLLSHLKDVHLNSVKEPGYLRTISDLESVVSFRCAFCSFSSKSRSRVDEHQLGEHYEDFEKNESFEYDQASSPDSLENLLLPETEEKLKKIDEELLVEVKTRKTNIKRKPHNDPSFQYRCARCQRRFATPSSLKGHLCQRKEEPVVESPPPQPKVSDILPNKRITSLSQMVNGFFKCPLCPQVFTDKKNHGSHINATHPSLNQPKSSSMNGFYGSII